MRKNYSDLIKDKNKRLLTAKAYKFQWQCIELIAKTKNINYCIYSHQIKELIKNKTLLIENK